MKHFFLQFALQHAEELDFEGSDSAQDLEIEAVSREAHRLADDLQHGEPHHDGGPELLCEIGILLGDVSSV